MTTARCLFVLPIVCVLATCASAAVQRDAARNAPAHAIEFVRAHANELGLTPADAADVVVASHTVAEHTGVTHVYLRQRHRGIDVWGAEMTVNVARDGAVVSHAGRLVALAAARLSTSPKLTPIEAAHAAATHLASTITEPIRVIRGPSGAARETLLSSGGLAADAIPARLAFFPKGLSAVYLAWVVEIEEPSAQHSWVVLLDAESGALLEKTDRVAQ